MLDFIETFNLKTAGRQRKGGQERERERSRKRQEAIERGKKGSGGSQVCPATYAKIVQNDKNDVNLL